MNEPTGSGPSAGRLLQELFERARKLKGSERADLLDRSCAGRPELRTRLDDLLRAHESMDDPGAEGSGFLEALDAPRAAALLYDSTADREEASLIGRYRIVERIGRGGMGTVYLARDPALDRLVALKLLPHHLGADSVATRRFVDEARAASALDHPHIATVYEIGEADDGRLFIAMAYCEGGTLRQRLADGPLPVDAAVEIARQVVEGLAAAHDRGIVHRDIKPENLVFGPQGAVRIVDFGVAKIAEGGLTRTGASLGTVAYMSPEQTRGGPVDHRTDVWSLGVVLYEMLTGRRPFGGERNEAVIFGIRNDVPSALGGSVPAPLAAIVQRCLEKDPERRYASAAELREALLGASRQEPAGWRPRLPRPTWRRGLAAAAAIVVLGLVYGLVSLRGVPRVMEASGAAGDAFAERGWVLVSDLEATDAAADVALAVREALTVDLQQSGFVNVLSRSQIAGILERMGAPADVPLELPLAREVAERAGAGAVLTASVSRLGSQFVLSGRAIHPGTGQELFAVRTSASSRRLLGAVEKLSREMRHRLGEESDAIARSRPLPAVTTSSLHALKLYAEADRLLMHDHDAAAALVAEAMRTDSTFAMAHRLAGVIASSQLRHGDARLHLTRAYELRDRLAEKEQWFVEATYHAGLLEPRRAADAYGKILRRHPEDWQAANGLGAILLSWLGDPDAAYVMFLRAVDLDPHALPSLRNATHTAFRMGRFAEADSLARLAEAKGFNAFASRWQLESSFALGRIEESAAICDSLLSASARAGILAEDGEYCGSTDVASGRLRLGISRLEAVERSYQESGRYRNIAHAGQAMAVAHILRGEPAAAAARIERVLDLIPAEVIPEPDRFFTRINLQVQAALLGRPDLVERIGAAYPPYPDPAHWISRAGEGLVRAARAVARGDGDTALRVLRAEMPTDSHAVGWRIWDELLRGHAFDLLGQPDSAAVRYERAAEPRFLPPASLTKDRIYLPIAVRRLAESEESRGNAPGAARAYGRLLDLWSGADAELDFEVEEMREALARLGGVR